MAIYTAYYDASGTQQSKTGAMVVLGIASTESRWLRFEREWEAVLRDFRVPFFHMKEYAHCRGPFESWKNDEERRAVFLGRLIAVLERNVNKAFCAGMYLPAYHDVDAEFLLSEVWGVGHPKAGAFAQCAHSCVGLVDEWMAKRKRGQRLHNVFEHGDAGMGAFLHGIPYIRAEEPPSIAVVPKVTSDGARVRQFEGADLMAWEFRNLYGMSVAGLPLRIRQSLVALIKQIPYEEGCLDEKALRQFCEMCEIPRRQEDD